jgi:hypothetical protein
VALRPPAKMAVRETVELKANLAKQVPAQVGAYERGNEAFVQPCPETFGLRDVLDSAKGERRYGKERSQETR